MRRGKRGKSYIPSVALVGYTNSGKSTLLNTLSGSKVLTQDKLFATLDPTVRKLYLSEGKNVLLTDTVGFIQKLPHQLIAAFSATLEEVTEADLLLHVVDISHPYFEGQIQAVFRVLAELKAQAKPVLTVFNKIDRSEKKVAEELFEKYHPAVAVSALYGRGLDELKAEISKSLFGPPPQSAPDPASDPGTYPA